MGKALHKGYEIFRQLFVEEEYRVLLYPFLFIFILLILLAALIPAARPSIAAFFAMAFLVVFLILLIVAARTGGLGVLERRSSRGGGFGGRG
jgi:hypothetical protein